MGVTLTTFTDGLVSEATPVLTNFTTIETFLNGGVATGDIAATQIGTQHVYKPEHYPLPLGGSLGISGDIYGRKNGFDRYDRSYHFWDMLSTHYTSIPDLMATAYIDASCWVELCASMYIQPRTGANVGAGVGSLGVVGYVRFTDNATPFAGSLRRIIRLDPGTATYTYGQNKDLLYITHMFQVTSTGWHNFGAEIRMLNDNLNTAAVDELNDAAAPTVPGAWGGSHNGTIIHGKSLTVEVHVL